VNCTIKYHIVLKINEIALHDSQSVDYNTQNPKRKNDIIHLHKNENQSIELILFYPVCMLNIIVIFHFHFLNVLVVHGDTYKSAYNIS
jgi:hypothetical protein